jgi:hypothetical protein
MRGTVGRQRLEYPGEMSVWEKLLKKALDTLQLETQRELVWINHKSMPATIGSDLNFRAVSPIMLLSSGGAKTINLNTHMLAPENFHGPLFLKNADTGDLIVQTSSSNVTLSQGEVGTFVKIAGAWNYVDK